MVTATQYPEDSWGNNSDYDSRYDGPKYDGEYRRKKNFWLDTPVSVSTRCSNSRDNIYDPHEGKRNTIRSEYAGLGGDFDFTKYSVDYRYYYHYEAQKYHCRTSGAGYASGNMPLVEIFNGRQRDVARLSKMTSSKATAC